MYLDIGFIILLIIFVGIGYRAGLVSMALSVAAFVLSLVSAMYISSHWLLINIPVFGYWVQTIILFTLFGFILRKLIDTLKFEKVLLVGFFSRVLGGLLYGVIFSAIVFVVVLVALVIAPAFLDARFPDSYLTTWVQETWVNIQTAGGLPKIVQDVSRGLDILDKVR